MTHDPIQDETVKVEPRQEPAIPDHTLLRCVGRGGYGEVWLARNVVGSFRAVKMVYRKTFANDRLYAREFNGIEKFEPISRTHPSLVSVLHIGRNDRDGYFFYIMEVADDANATSRLSLERSPTDQARTPSGPSTSQINPAEYAPRTLKFELSCSGKLSFDVCLEISLSLTDALRHLHRHGLIHRDIKPSNIIFVNGTPKIADIGLVTEIGDAVSFVGTQGYMPPEGPGCPAADVYSLGKVLSELVLKASSQEGREPPLGRDANIEPPGLLRLNEIILKACEPNVLHRYQTAEELYAELQKLRVAQKSVSSRAITGKRKLATILFTDMVGSTKLKQTLGDRDAVALMHHHHAVVREILSQFPDGQEISTAGDSFFLVFVKPSDAVRFALLLQSRLRTFSQVSSHRILDRIGIHIGEVVIEEREGAIKPRDLYGMQVDTCARVMSLAAGDQILMTRSAFDNARQALKGEEIAEVGPLSWVNHGLYQLSGVDEPLEICEVAEAGIGQLSPPPDSEKVQRVLPPSTEIRPRWRSLVASTVSATRGKKRSAVAACAVLAALASALVFFPSQIGKWFRGQTVPKEKQLAVLPFANIGNDQSNQAFGDGLVETITTKLTQLERFQGSLWVVPMSEVRKESITGARQAWNAFRATLVLTGSVQKDNDRVRLTINLVDAKTSRQLRSQMIDAPTKDIYALQDSVVREVAGMLELEFPPAAQKLLSTGQTKVSTAYQLYLQGLGELARFDKVAGVDFASLHLQEALRHDPQYALAYAALGEAYWRKYDATKETSWIDEARKNCSRALQLDDELAPAHVTLGIIYAGTGKYDDAIDQFQQALKLDRRNADAYRELAQVYERTGLLKEAEMTFQKAISLRPNFWAAHNELGAFYYQNGRYPEAVRSFSKVTELTPDSYLGYRNLGGIYALMGEYEKATEPLEKSLEIKKNPHAYSNLGTSYFFQGRYADAARMYEQAVSMPGADSRLWGNLADTYRFIPGQNQKATETYQKAIQMVESDLAVNPLNAENRASLAVYYIGLAEKKRALTEIEKAFQLSPKNVNVLFMSSLVYELAGDRARALQALEEAFKGGYSIPEIRRHPDLAALRRDPLYTAFSSNLKASNTNQNKTAKE